MAKVCGLGQVAERLNAPVLKFYARNRPKANNPSISAGFSQRITRFSRILHRDAMAHKSAQFIRRFLADETTGGSLTPWEGFKHYGWAFFPLLVLNEIRGLYVVMEVMRYA